MNPNQIHQKNIFDKTKLKYLNNNTNPFNTFTNVNNNKQFLSNQDIYNNSIHCV